MDDLLEHPRIAAATMAFYRDAGVADAALASLTGRDAAGRPRRGTTPQGERNLRGLIAVQSMLLDGYTPASAALWLRTPCTCGRAPRAVLDEALPGCVGTVLALAYDRMGS